MNNSAAHSALVHDIRLELGREPDLVLWAMQPGGVADSTGRPMRCGPTGMADLVGILSIPVQLMQTHRVPVQLGRLVAFEVKTGRGRLRPAQALWHALVRSRGGFACVVRSTEQARNALSRARRGERE